MSPTTGAKAEAWCLLIQADASLSLPWHGPPHHAVADGAEVGEAHAAQQVAVAHPRRREEDLLAAAQILGVWPGVSTSLLIMMITSPDMVPLSMA